MSFCSEVPIQTGPHSALPLTHFSLSRCDEHFYLLAFIQSLQQQQPVKTNFLQ